MPKQKPLKWDLPAVVHPPDTVCFQVRVPNERAYIGAFYGAMYLLSKPYAWADDEAHTAIEVGAVWREIFFNLTRDNCDCPEPPPSFFLDEDDMPELRQLGCLLQAKCFDGTWVTIYDPTACIADAIRQPGDGTAPGPGECKEWDVTVSANGIWVIPVPVSSGFVIEISDVQGFWGDGTLLLNCPDGQPFFAGLCVGVGGPVLGDPLPSANHMALIAGYDTTTPVYNLAYNSTIVIPGGVTDEQMWLQANDSALGNNSGVVTAHIKVCGTATPTGTHVFDFTASDGGWASRAGHNTTYSPGVGWVQGCDQPGLDTYSQAIIEKTYAANSHISEVRVFYDRVYSGFNDGATGSYAVTDFVEGGGGVAFGTDSSMATGSAPPPLIFNANPQDVLAGHYLTCAVLDGYLHNRGNCASLAGGSATISKIEVDWSGADPF